MPLSRLSVGTYWGNELTCNLSGNIQPQSSRPPEPLWTDPGIKSGISMHKLISISKKERKRAGRKQMVEHFPKILASKKNHHHLKIAFLGAKITKIRNTI